MPKSEHACAAEPGRIYPAWRDGRRITDRGPVLHAVTERRSGNSYTSGWYALCGKIVVVKVEDEFDAEDAQSCLDCSVAVLLANKEMFNS